MRAVGYSCLVFMLMCGVANVSLALDRQALEAKLSEVLDADTTAKRTTVALKVVDLKSGEVLFDRNGDRLFTPASNLKIYTSACALDTFGPDHRFVTKVIARIDQQTGVARDLVITGGGDAMFSSADLSALAKRVALEWGIKRVEGGVRVDNSRYSEVIYGPGWMWDDQPYYFNMQVTPTMLDFNVYSVAGKFDSDGDPVRRAVRSPSDWVVERFAGQLRARGVELGKAAGDQASAKLVRRELKYPGKNLAATLKHFNHVSENAVGEVLLHEIAIARGKRQPAWDAGAKIITDWLHKSAGLQQGSFRLVDGSGLSRYNLISADSSVRLLQFMRQHRHYQTFHNSLPTYGVETQSGVKTALVHAKPGGTSGVSTISGYLETLEGRQLAFSLLANGYIGSSKPIRELRGRVWNLLAKYNPTSQR